MTNVAFILWWLMQNFFGVSKGIIDAIYVMRACGLGSNKTFNVALRRKRLPTPALLDCKNIGYLSL